MRILTLVLLAACLWTCSGPQEPVFLKLENLKASKISTRNITFTGDALYHNPNPIGGDLSKTNIDVFAEGVKVATINQSELTSIPANAEFRIPISFTTSPKDLFKKDGKGLLAGAINTFLEKSVHLKYEGTITFGLGGVFFDTPIEYEEDVDL